jgi:serine/threonine protein kinase
LVAEKDLPNILDGSLRTESADPQSMHATLDDFELMCVLGRGGFGKVMQVRHKSTGKVYAMKILKKKELKRRRQAGFVSVLMRMR